MRNIILGLCLLTTLGFLTACERRAWKRTGQAGTVEAFQQYLKDYPEGQYVGQAWDMIEGLRLTDAKNKNTAAGYEAFLKDFPKSVGRSLAIANLMRLQAPEIEALTPDRMSNLVMEIVTSHGVIRFSFFEKDAPETCRNFIKLAKAHFYDGLLFHLVLPGQLIQAGAPGANPLAGPGYTIKSEFNDHLHVKGAVAMHHERYPDSGASQFYICLDHLPDRDRQYTVFGQVIEGIEVVESIGRLATNGPEGIPFPDRPLEDVIIKRVNLLTKLSASP